MAVIKITEKAAAAQVKPGAHILITQPETVEGVETEALRRATAAQVIGSAQEMTEAEKIQARENIDAAGVDDLVYPGTDAGAYRLVSICDGDATNPHTYSDWRNESGVTSVDLSRYPASVFILLDNGTFGVTGTGYTSIQIPTGRDIKKLYIRADETYSTVLGFAKKRMPDTPAAGDSYMEYLCEGETKRRTVGSNREITFTVPDDCAYIILSTDVKYAPREAKITSSLAARIAALEGGNSLTSAAAAE